MKTNAAHSVCYMYTYIFYSIWPFLYVLFYFLEIHNLWSKEWYVRIYEWCTELVQSFSLSFWIQRLRITLIFEIMKFPFLLVIVWYLFNGLNQIFRRPSLFHSIASFPFLCVLSFSVGLCAFWIFLRLCLSHEQAFHRKFYCVLNVILNCLWSTNGHKFFVTLGNFRALHHDFSWLQ